MKQSPATPLPPPKERRRLRERSGLTQAQLAQRLGVPRETVRAWESGRTTPRGRKREAYAALLTTPPEDVAAAAQAPSAEAEVTPGHRSSGTAGVGAETAVAASDAQPEPQPESQLDPQPETQLESQLEQDPEPAPAPDTPSEPAPADDDTGPLPVVAVPLAGPPPQTPAQAFDALYAFCAPALVRQAYLLTGRRELARESVERAFQLAWQRWPEVAVDRDPAGWVRAAAYEYALSPWHRLRPRHRHPEAPPADPADRALLNVLLTLPPSYRRTLLLHDGVGLGLPETAAETEASTRAAASRLLHAREEVAARLPDLSDPAELNRRLAGLAATERLRAPKPYAVRGGSERRAQFWTRAAIAFTVALIGATALTLLTAPTRYEPPVPPGETVRGVPPRAAPGPLSQEQAALRAKLREEAVNGPGRLVPDPR
ncbi:sigma factor-like helix-turn-helix DNA-binding protein [Streptomyces sp. NPDC006610]|uniref:sigma factor-like helix-turn-helix DNA-binding protein n=1 Tax=Streptomyces sp. NPDC006610 TaxID=3154584 RepID=UPI0033B6B5EF